MQHISINSFSVSSASSVVKNNWCKFVFIRGKQKITAIRVISVSLLLLLGSISVAEFDARKEVIKFMENAGMEKYLHAPVTVSQVRPGLLSIADEGIFAIQHELLTPEAASDPNVVIEPSVAIAPAAKNICIVTHGWLDKGENKWPQEMATSIADRVDPNDWTCISYDWKGGSAVITSVQAAEYARDIAGPRLAAAVASLGIDVAHVHLVGHSAGSWTIHSAAKRIAAANPNVTIHLTFLDAYVPEKWNPEILGHVFTEAKRQKSQLWAEHYYTRDITFKVTQHNLPNAHNVDITAIDPLIKEHEFPYRWYAATVTGKYTRWDEKNEKVVTAAGKTQYGFARSREAGQKNWAKSTQLKRGNKAIRIKSK